LTHINFTKNYGTGISRYMLSVQVMTPLMSRNSKTFFFLLASFVVIHEFILRV